MQVRALGHGIYVPGDRPYDIRRHGVSEYGHFHCSWAEDGAVHEENAQEDRKKQQVVKSAFNTLSFLKELEDDHPCILLMGIMEWRTGILVASKIADRVGITCL